MARLEHLRVGVREAREAYEAAEESLNAAARLVLIGGLLQIAGERPTIKAFELNATYEYDDEGGYYRCLSDSLDFGEAEADDQDEWWVEDLAGDWTQDALLKLFDIDDVGESLLSVERVRELAAFEGVQL
jgi:hypothetical protein